MSKILTVSIIGVGSRGAETYGRYFMERKDLFKINSLCDIKPSKLDKYSKEFEVEKCNCFTDEDEFFKERRSDVVVISTLDPDHVRHALKAIKLNYDILLEKPITNNEDELYLLEKEAKKYNVRILVCHVLRYTIAMEKVKEILESNAIGQLISIDHLENVAYWHQAHSFVRGNWRNSKETAPMILAKCSHDLDLLYWLMGNKKPARITSFGDLTYLKKENAPKNSSTHCTDCKIKDSCPFNAYYFYLNNKAWLVPMIGEDPTDEQIIKYLDHSQYSRCVFKCDNDVVDHQILNIEFEDKSTASHTMNAFTRWCYRDIKIMGTKGCIEGNFEDKKFKVYQFLNNQEREVDITTLTDDFVGHGGGDRILFNELIEYLQTGKKSISLTSLEESVVSHYLGFAAEKSRLEKGKVQEIIINEEK